MTLSQPLQAIVGKMLHESVPDTTGLTIKIQNNVWIVWYIAKSKKQEH